jgi:hypothetical protein
MLMREFALAALIGLALCTLAHAAGNVPAVNTDMGCTASGQAIQYTGSALGCAAPTRPTVTVSGLPTCNTGAQGQMYFVTDALAPVALAAIASGGSVKVGVTCNGTSWIVQ